MLKIQRGDRRLPVSSSVLLLILAGFVPFPAVAATPVEVELRDGRTVHGVIDPQTGDDSLWLRISAPSVELKSAFQWANVVAARTGKETVSVEELRRMADALKTAPSPGMRSDSFQHDPAAGWARLLNGRPVAPSPAPFDRVRGSFYPPVPRRVRSLHIEALPVNWDADLETDGLRVFLSPVDEFGVTVPVNGTVECRLVGRQLSPTQNRRLFPELGRWTKPLCASDFGPSGIVIELPFQQFHPEIDLDVGGEGLLTVRLCVPAEGTFDASAAGLMLRPLSRMRDELQLYEDSRFAPAERPLRQPRFRGSRFARPILRG